MQRQGWLASARLLSMAVLLTLILGLSVPSTAKALEKLPMLGNGPGTMGQVLLSVQSSNTRGVDSQRSARHSDGTIKLADTLSVPVAVVTSRGFDSGTSYSSVQGTVRNDSLYPLSFVKVYVTTRDSLGNVVESAYGYAFSNYVLPGEAVGFGISLGTQSWSTYSVSAAGNPALGSNPIHLTPVSSSAVWNSATFRTWNVAFRNDSDATVTGLRMSGIESDSYGFTNAVFNFDEDVVVHPGDTVTCQLLGALALAASPVSLSGVQAEALSAVIPEPDTPSGVIDFLSPNPTSAGSAVSFSGHGTDSLGHGFTTYQWRSNIDGVLSSSASFSTSSLSVGTHTIYFKARCSNGAWSPEVSRTLTIGTVVQPHTVTAAIDLVSPGLATVGSAVSFSGHGGDTRGHGFSAYEWCSSIDGTLASRAAFTTSALSPGTHTIYFRAQCSDGVWSSWTSRSLTVALSTATVYTPVAPSSMRRGHSYSIYGYVAPKHTSGTYLVTLRFYKKNSAGAYVYHHSVSAKRYSYSSSKTKYKAYTSLPHRGKWRVRAYHSCSKHAGSYSGYDYITVK